MSNTPRKPAVYGAIPLQHRASSPAAAGNSRDAGAADNETLADSATGAACAAWCTDRRNHRDLPDIQERDCSSVPVIESSLPGDVPKNLGVDIKLRLHRVQGRDCLSIAIDDDDFAFISSEQARRIAEDLLVMANQAQTDV